MSRNPILTLAMLDAVVALPRGEFRRQFRDTAVYDQLSVLRAVRDGAPLDSEQRRRFQDDSLAFFRHELDKLDTELVEPLFNVTWADDIDPLPVTMGEKSTSFIRTKLGAVGTTKVKGLPWINGSSNVLPNVSVTGEMLTKPLRGLGMEIVVDQFEMASSQLLGRTPIDVQKKDGLNEIYQLGIDQMVYEGDEEVQALGLINQPDTLVATAEVQNGDWLAEATTGDEIAADFQYAFTQGWVNTGENVVAGDVLLPTLHYAMLHTKRMSNTGETVASYITRTCLSTARNGRPVSIRPCKRLATAGVDGKPRMVQYTKRRQFVRFPMMAMKKFDPYPQGIAFHAPYAWIFGEVEIPRPETITYWDNLGDVPE